MGYTSVWTKVCEQNALVFKIIYTLICLFYYTFFIVVTLSFSKERYFKFILWNFQMCKQHILIMFTLTHFPLPPSGTLPTSWPPFKIIQLVFSSGVEFCNGVRATHRWPQPQIKVTLHPPRVIHSLYLLSGGLRNPLPPNDGLCNWLDIGKSCVVNM